MKIIRDTREQQPLSFSSPFITKVIDRKLDVGDYGCELEDGTVVPIVFDRKAIGDLFGSVGGKGYPRFKKEIIRAQESNTILFIIIEGTLSKVLKGYSRSQVSGVSMVYKLFTLWVKHGVAPIFCKDRDEMSEYITQFYIACGKQHLRENGKTKTSC